MNKFLLNDKIVSTVLPLSTTLLDYIRYEANLRGTKIGCREGDCGACTLLIGSPESGKIRYMTATSCLTPLANVCGKHVVTVEGLNLSGKLNRVQEILVKHSGTQCGFCTPGFIVSLCGYALQCGSDSMKSEAVESVDGNICRCTGYKSIERAAAEIADVLKDIDRTEPVEWLIAENFVPGYFRNAGQLLASLPAQKHSGGTIPVGGGTDLYVQKPEDISDMNLKYLFDDPELRRIEFSGSVISIGGSATVTDLMECKVLNKSIPDWRGFMKLVSSTPVRNIATVAGNLVNASPIGDLTIILLALDAKISLRNSIGKTRTISLDDFYHGYKKLNKLENEILTHIMFSVPEKGILFNFEKVSKRKYLDIASVNSAMCIEKEDDYIKRVRCSAGGVSPVPLYLKRVSELLSGRRIAANSIREAAETLSNEIAPISDVRGTESYKRLLARQLFYGHFLTLFPDEISLNELI